MVPVAYGQGQIQRGRIRVCILSPAIFKNVFDIGLYNFSIISNLFDEKRPTHALSKMYEQNASYTV